MSYNVLQNCLLVLNENSYSEWFSLMKNVKDAKKLEKEIRVLCLVMTYPSNHNTSARRVRIKQSKIS